VPPAVVTVPAPLRVMLNDRALLQPLTGVGHYIHQLLWHLPAVDADIATVPFCGRYLRRGKACPTAVSAADSVRTAHRAAAHQPDEDTAHRAVAHQSGPDEDTAHRAVAHQSGPDEDTAHRAVAHQSDADPDTAHRAVAHASHVPHRAPSWLRRAVLGVYGVGFRWAARRCQLYHEPNHIPLRCDLPTVTTMHDLSVLVHPEWHPADRVRWYERDLQAGVRQTRRFIAASEFTKREMIARLGIRPEIIDVTYQAPRPVFRPQPAEQVRRTLAALRLPERFFLYVGTLEPRKNLPGLLRAYAALPADVRRQNPLCIAGGWGWKAEQLRALLSQGFDEVRLLGYVDDAGLADLYTACTALAWPTLYEGFGLPPLEALACGAPVIVSDVTSLPEVVGDAGVRLHPDDLPAWTAALRRMAEDTKWRTALAAAGLNQAARFSWPRCAAQTAACYRAALEQ
jgi:glycosyltransferase involved in cell wall biosynthesis